jgi:hypothetical protein
MANATTRAADILLRAMGGRRVVLRMPAPAVPADPTEQLGLATPQFQDFPLAPAVYRKARATITPGAPFMARSDMGGVAKSELLVSASDAQLLEIVSASAEEAFGQPYVYRLVLRAPQAWIV